MYEITQKHNNTNCYKIDKHITCDVKPTNIEKISKSKLGSKVLKYDLIELVKILYLKLHLFIYLIIMESLHVEFYCFKIDINKLLCVDLRNLIRK